MSFYTQGRGRSSSSSRSGSQRSFRSGSFNSRQPGQFGQRRQGFRKVADSGYNHSRYIKAATTPVAAESYQSQHTFADFGLHDQLVDNVSSHNYTTPTPIQDQAIPLMMEGRDVVGIANTGTGKTAAFLLPLIHKIITDPSQGVLILAPTRELAVQIYDEFEKFAQNLPIGVVLCIGGTSLSAQSQRLRSNPHFVIGTPGRIKDLIMRHAFKPEKFTNVVLDEVDRMLDIGFRQDIEFLISKLSQPRHSAFFSATMNRQTEEVMKRLLTNPVTVTIEQTHSVLHIGQDVIRLKPGENKVEVLYQLLNQEQFERVIIFGRTKHGINKLEKQLFEKGISVRSIHGNKTQQARQRALTEFKRGRVRALLATDIAARGIDVDDVTHVINYDEPESYETYLHRIGRTGRAGKIGSALTFVG